ncbi:MAG: SprT family zinc-dependent metalloprotease [Deltaproteobacteria bacterium]
MAQPRVVDAGAGAPNAARRSPFPGLPECASRGGVTPEATADRDFEAHCRALVVGFATTWARPGLEETITIELSTRLTRAIGRAMPRSRRIRLAATVAEAPDTTIAEILCHEVAHIVAWDLFGASARPHGREWAALMRAAGFEPRIRLARLHRRDAPGSTSTAARSAWPPGPRDASSGAGAARAASAPGSTANSSSSGALAASGHRCGTG